MQQTEELLKELTQKEISDELKTKIKAFLKQYATVEDAQKALDEIKNELKDLFGKEQVKSVSLEDEGFRIECRESNKLDWDETGIFKIVAVTNHVDTVFPIVIDKERLTEEDLKKAGLLEKCKTRKFDSEAMMKLLTTNIFNLAEFINNGLLKVNKTKAIARVALKKDKNKK